MEESTRRAGVTHGQVDTQNDETINGTQEENEDVQQRNSAQDDEDESESLLNELLYCIASFNAIFTPVSITMILSALAVVYINTEETRAQGEAAFSQSYEVFELEDGNSGQNFAASVGNVMIMVSVICAMTFVIVILYKYRCMKIFLGYMVIVTTMLLGYFTSNMALVAIQKYKIRFDKISFAYIIWNYAIVGVMAIFFNTGIPKFVTQGYLVTSSVVLAWQLSYFNDWTAWTLLVMLALYDLFAVLTPCGPLKALTNLMSRPGSRPLPGLLYEARLPTGVERPNRTLISSSNSQFGDANSGTAAREPRPSVNQQDIPAADTTMPHRSSASINHRLPDEEGSSSTALQDDTVSTIQTSSDMQQASILALSPSTRSTQPITGSTMDMATANASQTGINTSVSAESVEVESAAPASNSRTGKIALALARLYKLPVVDDGGALRRQRLLGRSSESNYQRDYTPDEVQENEWTPQQLRTEVTAVFPESGGRIELAPEQNFEGKKYLVYNHVGHLLRTFVVNRQGRVLQVVRRETDDSSTSRQSNTIKLGLGDFIFYSVLVSKAALYSFPSFAACMLTILFGLGTTLVLLAVHGKALPALPISIFLAVLTFVMTRFLAEPYIQAVIRKSLYV